MARTKGISPDNPQRILEGIMYAISQSQQSGHLFLTSSELCNEALKLLGKKDCGENDVQMSILSLVLDNRLKEEGGRIYLPWNFHAEQETAKLAKAMIKPTPISGNVEQAIEQAEKNLGICLSEKQRDSVRMVPANNFSIITGGPGTGKTTVVKALVAVYEAMTGGSVAFAAPTGRASRRLSESVGNTASTLHSTLGMTEANDKANKLIVANKLVIDESSMIDMNLAHQLFKSLGAKTKLVLVGDYHQLPSVGAGNVFREMLLCGAIPATKLDTVYRQAQTSRINLNAHSILQNNTSLLYGTDFLFHEVSTPEEAVELVKELYFKEAKKLGVNDVQILSPMRVRGACCVNELNKAIQSRLNPESGET